VDRNGAMVPIVVVGWEVDYGKTMSTWLWVGDDGGMGTTLVVPPFIGLVVSLMIVVEWSCIRGSSIMCMMTGVDGEVNEVESLVCIQGGVVEK
jgi:hypothetical protein